MSNIPEKQSVQSSGSNDINDNSAGSTEHVAQPTPIFATVIKGLLMGSADAVPGVSGGTIALIVGIYERLVTAISHFDLHFIQLVCSLQIRKALVHVDFKFLASLLCGIVVALLAVASYMSYLLEHQRMWVLSVFFGLIAASSILVIRKIHLHKVLNWILLVIGAVFAFWLVGQAFMAGNHTLPRLFFCGIIAICAMILPGISGSYILLILGEYTYMVGVIEKLVHQGLRGQLPVNEFFQCLIILTVFASGCIVGIIGFTKLLRILLAKWEQSTLAVLCGFMIGSLRNLWPFQQEIKIDGVTQYVNIAPTDTRLAIIAFFVALGSMVFLLAIEWIAARCSTETLKSE